jgi:hypothetical protein
MVCTDYRLLVGGELRDSGTDGQEELYGFYWLLISGVWWSKRPCDRWDIRNFMLCTEYWLVVRGELWDSGTDGTRETVLFVLINDYWWAVNCDRVGQMGQEKLYGFYWLVNGVGRWTER